MEITYDFSKKSAPVEEEISQSESEEVFQYEIDSEIERLLKQIETVKQIDAKTIETPHIVNSIAGKNVELTPDEYKTDASGSIMVVFGAVGLISASGVLSYKPEAFLELCSKLSPEARSINAIDGYVALGALGTSLLIAGVCGNIRETRYLQEVLEKIKPRKKLSSLLK